ncbi:LysM peptidoglycan-binding domain-containing protein [Patescibacteria group bacterium]|nr:LysM peptidoglycan-binding domain-containing protein [Patescibacteria group bacterium]
MDTLAQMTISELLVWLWVNTVKTVIFYGAIWMTTAIMTLLLVNDKQQQRSVLKASAVMLPILGVVLFFAVGSIRLPAFDAVVNRLLGVNQSYTTVASAEPVAQQTSYSSNQAPATTPQNTSGTVVTPTTPAAAPPSPEKKKAASKQREVFKDERTLEEKRKNVFKLPPGMESSKAVTHKVVMGDTVYSLGRQYNVPPKSIIEINGLKNPDNLKVGDELKIP